MTTDRGAGECAELLAGLPGDPANSEGHAAAPAQAEALSRMRQALLARSHALVLALVDKVRLHMDPVRVSGSAACGRRCWPEAMRWCWPWWSRCACVLTLWLYTQNLMQYES